jgi:hypothetical protein
MAASLRGRKRGSRGTAVMVESQLVQKKTDVFGYEPVPKPLCPPLTLHELLWD